MVIKRKTLLTVVSYNVEPYIGEVLKKIPPMDKRNYDVLVVDNHSTDKSWQIIQTFVEVKAILHEANLGLGGNIKSGIKHALDNGYETFVIMAGNNKDDPREIQRLLDKINEGCDYVQGSRFLPGGGFANLPWQRYVLTKLYAMFFWIITGFRFRFTDAINGFRAYRLSIFQDKKFNIWQNWLNGYEFETYLQYYVVKSGYRISEVPVSKTYPSNKRLKYSHIRPIIDWINVIKPIFFLLLGLRK